MRSALHQAEEILFARVTGRLTPEVVARLETLVAAAADDDEDHEGPEVRALINADPGGVSLATMLGEIAKLEALRAIGLPADLFADVAPWSSRPGAPALPSRRRTISVSTSPRTGRAASRRLT